jgi:hypothetical protein
MQTSYQAPALPDYRPERVGGYAESGGLSMLDIHRKRQIVVCLPMREVHGVHMTASDRPNSVRSGLGNAEGVFRQQRAKDNPMEDRPEYWAA